MKLTIDLKERADSTVEINIFKEEGNYTDIEDSVSEELIEVISYYINGPDIDEAIDSITTSMKNQNDV